MKKFVSILLTILVILSCFIVPVYAESVDITSGDYYIRRKLCSFDASSNQYKEVAATTIFSDDLNSVWDYKISNSYLTNPTRKYFNYYSVSKTDNTLLCKKDFDLTIEMLKFSDYLVNSSGVTYNFSIDNIDIECGYINSQGEMKVLDPSCIELRNNTSSGYYDVIFHVPYQEEDIYSVYCRLYYVLNEGFNYPLNFNGEDAVYTMVNGTLNIDIDKGDKTSGLLASIIEFIKSIWETLKNIPNAIKNALTGLFEKIGTAITNMKNAISTLLENIKNGLVELGNFIIDGIKNLFLLPDDYFSTKFNALYDKLTAKLGILAVPLVIVVDFVNAFNRIGYSDGVIDYPSIKILGYEFISAGSIDFNSIINSFNSRFASTNINMWSVYLTFVDAIIILAFVGYCKKKYDNIVGGR